MEKSLLAILLTDTHLKESNIDINISVFKQTALLCIENGLNRIIHLGDVFDSRKAQSLTILKDGFLTILDMLRELNVTLTVIPGNHEKTDYKSRSSFLDPFREHPSLTIYDCHRIEILKSRDLAIHYLPFFSNQEYIENLQEGLSNPMVGNVKRNILLTHIGVTGAVMNNGVSVEGIEEDSFSLFDQVFIGHYHDKQILKNKFNYIGGSIQHNFGETSEKGATLLFDDLSFETYELEFPRYHKIEVLAKDLCLADIEEIRKEKQTNKDHIRIILVGSESDIKSFDKQALINTGVSISIKEVEVDRKEVDSRIEPFTSGILLTEFDQFCIKNELNLEIGKKYLHQALKLN